MILGGILAGGASSRMGTDKALVEVADRPMVEWVAEALAAVTDRVVIVGRSRLDGFEVIPDPVKGSVGPLAGVVAALAEAASTGRSGVLVVAVDQPFVRPATLRRLVGLFEDEAVVPVADGIRQVTCAVYPAAWHPAALAELEAGGSIQSLLDRMNHRLVSAAEWAEWGEEGASWFSVDDADALAAGRERFGSLLE